MMLCDLPARELRGKIISYLPSIDIFRLQVSPTVLAHAELALHDMFAADMLKKGTPENKLIRMAYRTTSDQSVHDLTMSEMVKVLALLDQDENFATHAQKRSLQDKRLGALILANQTIKKEQQYQLLARAKKTSSPVEVAMLLGNPLLPITALERILAKTKRNEDYLVIGMHPGAKETTLVNIAKRIAKQPICHTAIMLFVTNRNLTYLSLFALLTIARQTDEYEAIRRHPNAGAMNFSGLTTRTFKL